MTAVDPFAAELAEFRAQLELPRPWQQTYLGDPPSVDGRNRCTFCGSPWNQHLDRKSIAFTYDASRALREFHRDDFGVNGYWSDEPRLDG